VHVTVDETWNYAPAIQVNPLRRRTYKAQDLPLPSRSHEMTGSNCERFGLGVLSVKRCDLAVEEDQISRICRDLLLSSPRLAANCSEACIMPLGEFRQRGGATAPRLEAFGPIS